MCGRYAFFTSEEHKEMNRVVEMIQEKYGKADYSSGEIYPSNQVPILLPQGQKIDADLLTWGFPGWNKKGLIINARSETADEKRMFAPALRTRRCIVPSSGFYEWKKQETGKAKYFFSLPGKKALYMAGLFSEYEGLPRFVILTTAANPSMAPVHHRMPLILKSNELKEWLFDDHFASWRLHQMSPQLEAQAV